MKNPIHEALNKLEPTEYHEQYRPYNFKEACLIVLGLAVLFSLVIFTVLSITF